MKPFIHLSDVKEGDSLVAGDRFRCIDDGQVCVVGAWPDGKLFVPCRVGPGYKHSLEPNKDGVLIGFYAPDVPVIDPPGYDDPTLDELGE